jgi:hypothetical protein
MAIPACLDKRKTIFYIKVLLNDTVDIFTFRFQTDASRGKGASRFPRYAQVWVLRLLVPAGVAAV